MRDENFPKWAVSRDWLRVSKGGTSGGGVPSVADGQAAGDDVQGVLIKDAIDEAKPAIEVEFLVIVGCGDASAFLAAVLQGEDTEKGCPRGVSAR